MDRQTLHVLVPTTGTLSMAWLELKQERKYFQARLHKVFILNSVYSMLVLDDFNLTILKLLEHSKTQRSG